MTRRRVLGVMLVIFGIIWMLQGAGWLAGGFLGGEPIWSALGMGLSGTGGWILLRTRR